MSIHTAITMAMFTDIQFDKASNRHELHFVNQQYDLLMCIFYDEQTKTYKLNVTDEEARQTSQYWWGHDFEVAYWIKEAEKRLKEADSVRNKQ